MHRLDRRIRKIVHAGHRPLADQILRSVHELQEAVAREMQQIVGSGRWRRLTDSRERNLGNGVAVKVTVEDGGDYLKLRVDWPSNGGRSLLNALLVERRIAVGAFSPRDNDYGKYLTCCIDGPDGELFSAYKDLKHR